MIARGNWKNEDFDRIEFCSDYDIEGLDTNNVTYGIGVPLIAVRKCKEGVDPAEQYYPEGLSFPITALLRLPRLEYEPTILQNSATIAS